MTIAAIALDLFPDECPAPTQEQLAAAKQSRKATAGHKPKRLHSDNALPERARAATPATPASSQSEPPQAPDAARTTKPVLAGCVEVTAPLANASAGTEDNAVSPVVPDNAKHPKASGDYDLESMASLLEAHPDYRVLRRLQPRLQWPPSAPNGHAELDPPSRILVLDTETTGLDSSKDRIIEMALLRVDVSPSTGLPIGPVEVYDELEDPGRPIPKEVVAITGIQDADVRGKALDEARVAAMLVGVDVVIAHNAGFDRPFVEKRFPQFAQVPWVCSFADLDWKAMGQSSAKLESLAQSTGFFYDAHRAEMDCHALLAVLAVPLEPQASAMAVVEAPVELNAKPAAHTGLAKLLRAAKKPSYMLQASNAPFESKDLLKARGYRWNAEQRVWGVRIADDSALEAECQWLRAQVYGARSATIKLEKQDALNRYSGRAGQIVHHPV